MKRFSYALASLFLFCAAQSVSAETVYNPVPAGSDQAQYKRCIVSANKNYEGGNERSPVAGQTKAQAFCTCMWNETPDDFEGGLLRFSESPKGKKINKVCEKHADWQG